MNKLKIVLVFLFLGTFCSKYNQQSGFVKVNGTQFTLDGNPYYFVGTNFWYGAYLGQPGKDGDRERLLKELDVLKANGLTNLRIMAASEKAEHDHALNPFFTDGPGVHNENLLIGLDFLLAEMAKRDMKAVIFMNNMWEWSGGFVMWNEWFGGGKAVDPTATGLWHEFQNHSAQFYTNKPANEAWRAYLKKVITRKNSVTGKEYIKDPTIMAWQLANEPRPGSGDEGKANIPNWVTWIEETALFIKSLDKNHLVSTGNEGLKGSELVESAFLDAHDSPQVDYATFHMWAKNWSWYKADSAEQTFPQALKNAEEYLDTHINYGKILNKPIVMEEFGLGRDLENHDSSTSTTYRDQYFSLVFKKVEEAMLANSALAGTNFWAWGGFAKAKNADFTWKPCDPIMGDPPQEPQGLNSVFATDSTTLNIIKKHAAFLTKTH